MVLKPTAASLVIPHKVFFFSSYLFFVVSHASDASLCAFFQPDDPCCAQYVSERVPGPAHLTMENILHVSSLLASRVTALTFPFVGRRDEERVAKSSYGAVIWGVQEI